MVRGRAKTGDEVAVGEDLGESTVDECIVKPGLGGGGPFVRPSVHPVQEGEFDESEVVDRRVELGSQPRIEVGFVLVCRGAGEVKVTNDELVRVVGGGR